LLMPGMQRKSPRRDVVRILQREKNSSESFLKWKYYIKSLPKSLNYFFASSCISTPRECRLG
jgi:hypothetical protein